MSAYTTARDRVSIPPCDVARVIAQVQDPAFEADLEGPTPTARIAAALRHIGVLVSTSALTTHRALDCACVEEGS